MYDENPYFDLQSMPGPGGAVDDPSQTVANCSGLSPLLGCSSTSSPNSLEENIRLANLSLEDQHHHKPSDQPHIPTMGIELQQQLGFDLEHDFHNSHLYQDVLQNPNQPQMDHQPSWDSGVQEIQDMSFQNHQQQVQYHHDLYDQEQQQQCFNSYTPTPDLLNLLHLPRCSVSSMLPNSSISFNNKSGDFHNSLDSSSVLYDPPLHLNLPPQPPLFRELFHSLPHNYSLPGSRSGSFFGGMDEREGSGGTYQDGDGMQFENAVLDFRRDTTKGGEARGNNHGHFATERQRREQLNEKYKALKLLVPNPTKNDRASVVGDAIDYIKELLRTVNELKILVEQKRCGRDRSKRPKTEDETAGDMESSCMKPLVTLTDREQSYNGSLRSSWLQRKSKETEVDVRIIDDEVTIKLIQRKKMNCLLFVSKILDELQLDLLHVAGGNIGDYYSFLFNTKIYEGSSVYASAIAKKLIEAVDRQYAAFPPPGF